MGHGADPNDFQQYESDSSQDMLYQDQQSEMYQEDATAQYDMYEDTSRAEQQYQTDSQQVGQNQYAASEDDVFRQELGDPSTQVNPDMDSGFKNGAENAIGNESFSSDSPVDALDERIEQAINVDLEIDAQQDAQFQGDLKEPSLEVFSDGPIGLHDLGSTVADDEDIHHSEDSLEDNEVLAVSPEAIDLQDAGASKTKPRIADEASAEEEISAGWVQTDLEEDEHFELPDWVVGNADPLVPPHLSGAEKVTGNYHMDTMAPKEGQAKPSTTDKSLASVNTGKPQTLQDQMTSVHKPPARRARHVASPNNPTRYPVFLDSVTTEVVAGDQVQLPELTFWMSEAKVQKWCKTVGDPVHVGETLMIVACDTKISKDTLQWEATQDVKATSNGFLVSKHFGKGEMMSIGWTVGVIGTSTEGLPTVDPEPIVAYVDEDISKEHEKRKEKSKPKVAKLSSRRQKKKAEREAIENKAVQSIMKKKNETVKNKTKIPTAKSVQNDKKEQAAKKPGWKSAVSVDWEPKLVKTDGLNHVLIPFLQKKIEAWERNAKFQLPASSLDQEVLTSSKTKMTIRWEPHPKDKGRKKSRAEKREKLLSRHCFASLPAVSWQFEKSQLPAKSSPATKEKITRQIFFFEPKAEVPRKEHGRQRLGGEIRWASFPRMIKWENATHTLPQRQYPETLEAENDDKEHYGLVISQKMIYATPMARAAARMANLDLQHVSGTGDGGRITLDDVKDVLYPMLMKEQEEEQQKQQQLLQPQQNDQEQSSIVASAFLPLPSPNNNKFSETIHHHSLRIPYATPMARKLAEEHQIDLATVMATGPRRRILLEDVRKVLNDKTTR